MAMNHKKAIVIGAGIAGMGVALRLKKAGYEVNVFEQSLTYGGKIRQFASQGFRFDTGPSLFTLPELVDELFYLFDKNPRDYYKYLSLESITRYFYENEIALDSFSNPERFAEEAEHKLGVDRTIILSFLKSQEKSYKLLAPIFLENPIHKPLKLLKTKNIPALFHVMNPRFLQSMNSVNEKVFKNSKLTRLFNRYGTYNGSNPYQMPSLFNIISHLEHNVGAFLPERGIRSIADALYSLATEHGVNFNFNSLVKNIEVENGTAKGVWVNEKFHKADVVVSNMDVNRSFAEMLPNIKPPKIFLENQKSTSALIFHWGIEGEHPSLDVHNILFAKNYKEEFQYLFDKKLLYHDPTIYIYISSKAVAGDAPAGKENWFVMINTPHLTPSLANPNTDDYLEMKSVIIEKIKKYTGIDISDKIVLENITTPIDLQNTTGSYLGSLYGASSNSLLSAFLRHPNFSKIKNLYFCGGTVHPGGGIPLCLMSAKITAQLINEDIP